jgi:crotonobetainyl-CoA:carnitine CoA-transferase CaiB-like acyl-CoA transferase
MGADIVKVEPPSGDSLRALGPFPGGQPHPEKSGTFLYLNCNKRAITLDTATAPGLDALKRLIAGADVFVHDFTPGEAEGLGLTYQALAPDNPRLVMTSIFPFGSDGPYRDYEATDLTTLAAGGWLYINGWPGFPELPPLKPYGRQSAYQAGVTAALATMGALFHRVRSGRGQHVEISAQECIASIIEMTIPMWSYMNTPVVRWGNRPIHPIDFFECKDGGWIFALCIEEHQWQALVELMGTPEWTTWEVSANRFVRASNWDALRPFMAEWVAQWNTDDLYRAAQEKRVPFAPASTLSQLVESEHLKARGFFVDVSYPEAGEVTQPGAPFKLGKTPWAIRSPAPVLGQHTGEVLSAAGLSDSEIAAASGGVA